MEKKCFRDLQDSGVAKVYRSLSGQGEFENGQSFPVYIVGICACYHMKYRYADGGSSWTDSPGSFSSGMPEWQPEFLRLLVGPVYQLGDRWSWTCSDVLQRCGIPPGCELGEKRDVWDSFPELVGHKFCVENSQHSFGWLTKSDEVGGGGQSISRR